LLLLLVVVVVLVAVLLLRLLLLCLCRPAEEQQDSAAHPKLHGTSCCSHMPWQPASSTHQQLQLHAHVLH
jgi:hypothetical protein